MMNTKTRETDNNLYCDKISEINDKLIRSFTLA